MLDRENGRFLRATPLVKKLSWAERIDAAGRPVNKPEADPTPQGTTACPAVEGATNWFSPAFNSATGLFYVQTLEKCTIYKKTEESWNAGRSFYGGSTRDVPGDPGMKVLRAFDLKTGKVAWEREEIGPATSWGGVLSLASDIVFSADDDGAFTASDSRSGRVLWTFQANQNWKASPMTYTLDGKQYVAIAAGGEILAFSLPD